MLLRMKSTGQLVMEVKNLSPAAKDYSQMLTAISLDGEYWEGTIIAILGSFMLLNVDTGEPVPRSEVAPGDFVKIDTAGAYGTVMIVDREPIDSFGFDPTKTNGDAQIPVCIMTGPNAGYLGWMLKSTLEEVI